MEENIESKHAADRSFRAPARIASASERLIWERVQRNPGDPGLSITYGLRLHGPVSISVLDSALRVMLVEHYPNALKRFRHIDGILYSQVYVPPPSILNDYRNVSTCGRRACPPASIALDHVNGPLFDFSVYAAGDCDDIELFVTLSHLIYDGTCYEDLCGAMAVAYAEALRAQRPRNGPPPHQPKPLESTETGATDEGAAFWKAQLAGQPLGQALPFLRVRDVREQDLRSAEIRIHGEELAAIRRLAQQADASMLDVMLTCSAALLGYYFSRLDETPTITLWYTTSLRQAGDPIGCYVNLTPLIVPLTRDMTGIELLRIVKAARDRARSHEGVPVERLLSFADAKTSQGGLLNVIVNQSPGLFPRTTPRLEGLEVTLIRTPQSGGPYDLAINFDGTRHELRGTLEVHASLACDEQLAQLAQVFTRVAALCGTRPEHRIRELRLDLPFTPIARGLQTDPTPTESIIGRIWEAARTAADKPAVVFGDVTLTYSDLIARVDAAARLVSSTVPPGELARGIGVHLSRSEQLPVAALTALYLGVPFIPLEPGTPPDRLAQIIDATKLTAMFVDETTSASCDSAVLSSLRLLRIDEAHTRPDERGRRAVPPATDPLGTAYILFTSGSTGQPKGVRISRANLLNFLLSMEDCPGFFDVDRILALTPISFDISILELLLPLFAGGTVDIADDATRHSADLLAAKIEGSGATVVQGTPSLWRLLRDAGWQATRPLKLLIGGEALGKDLAEYYVAQGHSLYNMYGPTETTIWVSVHPIRRSTQILLGRPVRNTEFFVVDTDLAPVPLGVPGQLVIRGACVGQGYLNGDAKSAFRRIDPHDGTFYFTGDRVRHWGAGQLEFLGRLDNQVKIRGFRVELDEVTTRVSELVQADVVTAIRTTPEPHLLCFYCNPRTPPPPLEAIFRALRRALPDYMVPQAITRVERFPLTPNGKVDVKALLAAAAGVPPLSPASIPDAEEERAPESATLQALRALIRDTLDIEIADPALPFGWYGLNSLSYNRLSTELARHFGLRFPPQRFFAVKTLAGLAGHLSTLATKKDAPTRSPGPAADATRPSNEDVAIIGIAALMPGSLDADAFWDALVEGRDLITESTRPELPPGFRAGFLQRLDHFDHRFFEISPLEAQNMDPRQRLLLQTAWSALEDAGYAPAALAGRNVGCYVAATGTDYALLHCRNDVTASPYSLPGNAMAMLSNRLSSFFDWRGPSCTLDTACSGSLAALVKACRDLNSSATDLVLVGAANIIADRQSIDGLLAGGFLSLKGRCAAFDAGADGYVRGEGICCVLAKRYTDAVRDGDAIHAIIRSAAENHGGRATSLTAPNPDAQRDLYLKAYTPELARQVTYIETHGTGTALGDPIEIDALKAAWEQLAPDAASKIGLGSVKSTAGHLEAAAGLAGVIKVVLAFRHGVLPGNPHLRQLNPLIQLTGSPFEILDADREWACRGPRVAGVSSFGFGGANAHVVLQEPLAAPGAEQDDASQLIVIAARSAGALESLKSQMERFLTTHAAPAESQGFSSFAYTLGTGRTHFAHRLAWIASNPAHLLSQMRATGVAPRVALKSNAPAHLPPVPASGPERSRALEIWRTAYLDGYTLNFASLYDGATCRRLHLPTYRFDTVRHWLPAQTAKSTAAGSRAEAQPLPAMRLDHSATPGRFDVTLPANHPFLLDHTVHGRPILPGTAQIELALQAVGLAYPERRFAALTDGYWIRPLALASTAVVASVQITERGDRLEFTVADERGRSVSSGALQPLAASQIDVSALIRRGMSVRERAAKRFARQAIYREFAGMGIDYGPHFRLVEDVAIEGQVAYATLTASPGQPLSHATVLDCTFQVGMCLSIGEGGPGLMPFSLGSMRWHVPHPLSFAARRYVVVVERKTPSRGNLCLLDERHEPLLSIFDLGFRPARVAADAEAAPRAARPGRP